MTNHPNQIQFFETQDGRVNLQVRLQDETVWLSTEQMSSLFARERSVLTKHINNVFKDAELEQKSNVQNLHIAFSDKPIKLYSLDVIISVGYRVKSPRGVLFRKWATQTLKQHLVQGYTLNQQRFEENALTLEKALELVRKTARSPELNTDAGRGLIEIVSRYTQTFLWLQRYDEGLLNEPAGQSGGQLPSAEEATSKLQQLKQSLIAKGEATALFAQPRDDGLAAILGKPMTTENRFNLIDEPWIPIVDVGQVSLGQLFRHPEYRALGGNPVQKIALTKLLLAIAQAASTPDDDEDWAAMGAEGLAQKCLQYLEQWHDRFYLHGKKPFSQMVATNCISPTPIRASW